MFVAPAYSELCFDAQPAVKPPGPQRPQRGDGRAAQSLTPRPRRPERFRIEHRLGAGGSARVYQAVDRWARRRVALKVSREDPTSRAAVEREARLMARLGHRHVLRVHELVNGERQVQLVMECCLGGSLARRFRVNPLPVQGVLRWLIETCSALEYLHAQELLHLDVKPHNLLLTDRGAAQLADFGSAWDRRHDHRWQRCDESRLMTPYYMAPEQWEAGAVDERTDLWAVGVVLHEAFFGVRSAPPGIAVAARSAARQRAFEADGAPPEAARLLCRALAPDPNERFQSATELRRALIELRRALAESSGVIASLATCSRT